MLAHAKARGVEEGLFGTDGERQQRQAGGQVRGDHGQATRPQREPEPAHQREEVERMAAEGVRSPAHQLLPSGGMKLNENALPGMLSVGVASRIAALIDASRPIGVPLALIC